MESIRTRPRVRITPTPTQVGLSIFTAIGVIAAWVIFVLYYGRLPDIIYTHFGPAGTPDATGPKGVLYMIPILATALGLMITLVMRVPHIYNYPVPITEENAERQYGNAVGMMYWLRAEVVYLFVYTEWMMIQTALGRAHGIGVWFLPVMLLATFGSLGYFVVQAYRNR